MKTFTKDHDTIRFIPADELDQAPVACSFEDDGELKIAPYFAPTHCSTRKVVGIFTGTAFTNEVIVTEARGEGYIFSVKGELSGSYAPRWAGGRSIQEYLEEIGVKGESEELLVV